MPPPGAATANGILEPLASRIAFWFASPLTDQCWPPRARGGCRESGWVGGQIDGVCRVSVFLLGAWGPTDNRQALWLCHAPAGRDTEHALWQLGFRAPSKPEKGPQNWLVNCALQVALLVSWFAQLPGDPEARGKPRRSGGPPGHRAFRWTNSVGEGNGQGSQTVWPQP